MTLSWPHIRRVVTRYAALLDVVMRSDPEVCGFSGDGFQISLHHSGKGDCTVGRLSLVDCSNELVLLEFERWMEQAGHHILRADTDGIGGDSAAVDDAPNRPRADQA